MTRDLKASPNAVPWPPIILVLSAAAALALERYAPGVIPLPLGVFGAGPVLGWILMALGAGLDIWSILTFKAHQTNVLPHRAAGTLVTSGPYAFSRNPIYLGNTLMLAGAAFAFALPWFLPVAFVAAILFYVLAIRPEETHMALKFGPAWDDYAARTPRWIWRI